MPNTYQLSIQKALKSAKYHEDLAFLYAHPNEAKYDELVTHLRSYYWELWSVWEYIIQAVNEHSLNLDKQNVREDFIKKLKKERPDYPYAKDLEKVFNNERLIRINQLRNYSHKWQIDASLVEIDENDKVNVIAFNPKGSEGTLPRQINIDKNDLWFMTETTKSFSIKGII